MFNEKGNKAECINVGKTINLTKYEEYYVYPNGENTFYVSRFPYPKKSLLGVYDKLFFRLKEDIAEIETAAVEEIPASEIDPEPENYEQISLF